MSTVEFVLIHLPRYPSPPSRKLDSCHRMATKLECECVFLADVGDRPVLTTLHRPGELKQGLDSPKRWMWKILISYTTEGDLLR